MNFKLIFLSFVVLYLTGCNSIPLNTSFLSSSQKEPKIDKATVHFIRSSDLGFARQAALFCDDDYIGVIPYGNKRICRVSPGAHRFMVMSDTADFLDAELKPGKHYFVRVEVRMGIWTAKFSLSPILSDEMLVESHRKWISSELLADNTPESEEWLLNYQDKIKKIRAESLADWSSREAANKPKLNIDDFIDL